MRWRLSFILLTHTVHETVVCMEIRLNSSASVFKKKTDFKKVTQIEVTKAVNRLNTLPRKLLDFKTPIDLMTECRTAQAV
ncbi:MAG: hypothetical protein ACI9ES_002402 [Oceanospirillaceae bacterium]|jgi:hypothetical protein